MDSLTQRFSVIAGFSLLVALLLGSSWIIRNQVSAQVENQNWLARSADVRLALEQTQTLLTDAETGQRGFLYTGNPKYLTPYNEAITNVERRIQDLRELTSDNPRQHQNLAAVAQLTSLKLQELASTIELYRAGKPDEARATVLSDRGLMIMTDLRRVLGQMKVEEERLEGVRETEYLHSIRVTVACIYATSAIAVLGLILLAYYILRERNLRETYARELRTREEWLRVTLTSIGDAVIATDAQGKVTFLNPVAESLTGISHAEALNKHIDTIFPIFNEFTGAVAENPVAKVMSLGVVVGLANHTALRHRDGHMIPIEDSAAPIRAIGGETLGVVLVFHDVTAERNSQEVLRRTEKLAAAARLSATVAHEINNPLEAVTNILFLTMMSPELPPDIREQLSLAERELERVAHITRQTLGFYRDSTLPEHVDIASIVEAVLKLYHNKIESRHIEIDHKMEGCPTVWGAPGELKQVISNLLSNAIDAVPYGGKIAIYCARRETPQGFFGELIVEDSGPGVSPEHAPRIFDPFFTTKKDVGTGLGLWVTQEIVSRHGGTIALRKDISASGLRGASFIVLFPSEPANPGVSPESIPANSV
ncbi:MAG TPA: CHASE3 domain-containing protein [Terracidiphilus sp.]|nr:CHASE3 domain-containing protein [Terracidiphilus sp.]